MRRICHVTSVHSRYDGRIFQKECRSLAAAGYEVHLLVADDKEDEVVNNVHIHSLGQQYDSRIKRILFAPKQIYKKAREINAEVYHLHDPELLRIARKLERKKKVVFDSHEASAEQIRIKTYLSPYVRKLVAALYKKYERHVLKYISAVIFPCLYEGKDYFEGNYKKLVYIDNLPLVDGGIEVSEYKSREGYSCYVGALSEARGINQIIQAAEKAQMKLVVAGRGMDLTYSESQYLEFRGFVARKEAEKIIGDSSIGLCVLQNNGQYGKAWNLPTKICEYMMAGIPIVMSDFSYYKKMNEKYGFGICVPPNDVEAIAEALIYLRNHKLEAEEMGKRGRKLVLTELNWKREEEKLLELYNDLLS